MKKVRDEEVYCIVDKSRKEHIGSAKKLRCLKCQRLFYALVVLDDNNKICWFCLHKDFLKLTE